METEPSELARIREAASSVFEIDEIEAWLRAPNRLLEGRAPMECVADRDAARVLALIEAIADGVFV